MMSTAACIEAICSSVARAAARAAISGSIISRTSTRLAELPDSHHQAQRVSHSLGGAIDNDRAPAGSHVNQPLLRECLHGFAYCCAAGTKLLAQFAFGWQTVTAAQFAAQNAFLDLRRYLLIDFV